MQGISMIKVMKTLAAAVFFTLLLQPAFATPQDYRFEITGQPVKAGHDAVFAVRVTQLSTGKDVAFVPIATSRLHMVMGTRDEAVPFKALAANDGRFSADLTMYGEWTFDVTATVAGEKEPVKESIKFQVAK